MENEALSANCEDNPDMETNEMYYDAQADNIHEEDHPINDCDAEGTQGGGGSILEQFLMMKGYVLVKMALDSAPWTMRSKQPGRTCMANCLFENSITPADAITQMAKVSLAFSNSNLFWRNARGNESETEC